MAPGFRLLSRGFKRLGHVAFDTLLPPLCPGCEAELRGRRWLCGECRRRLEPVPDLAICFPCRAQRRPEGNRRAGFDCRLPAHRDGLGRAAFWLEDPLDRLIHALKYEGRRDLARPLASLMAERLHGIAGDAVTAVPLHRARRRERGYNQADLLARRVSRSWEILWVEDALFRRRATRPQARTPEARRGANVAGAFEPAVPGWIRGRTWVLVDDVATTGATLMEAAGALERAGASGVVPAVLALA